MDALYYKVANKWKPLGVQLEISEGVLATIAEGKMGDLQLCLLEMLEQRLKRVDPPPTWSAIAEAGEFLGEEQLARELRQKYCQRVRLELYKVCRLVKLSYYTASVNMC